MSKGRTNGAAITGFAVIFIVFVMLIGPDKELPKPNFNSKPTPAPTVEQSKSPSCEPDARDKRLKDPKTKLVLLIDTSGSFHDSGAFDSAIEKMGSLSRSFASAKMPRPMQITVLAIDDASNDRSGVCDIYLPSKNLFAPSCSEDSIDAQWVACDNTLRLLARAGYTDISGALDRGRRILGVSAPAGGYRAIFLVSDLDEVLPPKREPVEPDLGGICIMLISERKKDDKDFTDRKKKWEERLKDLGANTMFQPLLGLHNQATVEYLRGC